MSAVLMGLGSFCLLTLMCLFFRSFLGGLSSNQRLVHSTSLERTLDEAQGNVTVNCVSMVLAIITHAGYLIARC